MQMETAEDFAVVPDTQGAGAPSSGGFQAPRPGLFPHGVPMAEHAYMTHFAPKPFAFDGQVACFPTGTSQGPASLPSYDRGLVPQLQSQPVMGSGHRLTASQQSELEVARKRAEKAAEGKRANQTAARRAKRRATRAEVSDHDGAASSDEMHQQRDEIEAKLATVEDEKEAKRLKRLLRNRVSAQQARERKKSYVTTLESKAQQQEERMAQLEQRVKVVERENVMLRSVIKNMQGGAEEGASAPAQSVQMNGVQR